MCCHGYTIAYQGEKLKSLEISRIFLTAVFFMLYFVSVREFHKKWFIAFWGGFKIVLSRGHQKTAFPFQNHNWSNSVVNVFSKFNPSWGCCHTSYSTILWRQIEVWQLCIKPDSTYSFVHCSVKWIESIGSILGNFYDFHS